MAVAMIVSGSVIMTHADYGGYKSSLVEEYNRGSCATFSFFSPRHPLPLPLPRFFKKLYKTQLIFSHRASRACVCVYVYTAVCEATQPLALITSLS